MFRAMAINSQIMQSLLLSCFMWGGTLDCQLWCSSIISYNNNIIAHNHHTNNNPTLNLSTYTFTSTMLTQTYIIHTYIIPTYIIHTYIIHTYIIHAHTNTHRYQNAKTWYQSKYGRGKVEISGYEVDAETQEPAHCWQTCSDTWLYVALWCIVYLCCMLYVVCLYVNRLDYGCRFLIRCCHIPYLVVHQEASPGLLLSYSTITLALHNTQHHTNNNHTLKLATPK